MKRCRGFGEYPTCLMARLMVACVVFSVLVGCAHIEDVHASFDRREGFILEGRDTIDGYCLLILVQWPDKTTPDNKLWACSHQLKTGPKWAKANEVILVVGPITSNRSTRLISHDQPLDLPLVQNAQIELAKSNWWRAN